MGREAQLHLLGVQRAERGRSETVLAGVQPRLLLTHLVLAEGHPVAHVELGRVLWPDGRAAHWEGALRGVVAKARAFLGALGPEVATIENHDRQYSFHALDARFVDVWAAEHELADAEASLAAGRVDEAARAAGIAAGLLGRPLLLGVEAAWLTPWRNRFEGAHRRALRIGSAAHAQLGRHDEAVALATAAASGDVFDEESQRALMRAHAAAGNRAAALRVYGECRRLLADELGVAPDERTEALYLDLLALEPVVGRSPGAARRRAVLPVPGETVFVGRVVELETIASAWSAARGGSLRVVLLHGEAGIGKTRLAAEAIERAEPDNTLYGRASAEQVVPFEPIAEALGRHLTPLDDPAFAELVGSVGPDLAGLVPVVAHRTGGESASESIGDGRSASFGAVRAVLARIAEEPTIMVLDDLQWADTATLGLLRRVLRAVGDLRLLVIITYRDDGAPDPELIEAIAELRAFAGGHVLEVGGLEVGDVAELLRRQEIARAAELAPTLWEQTAGNGFYLAQVLAAADELESFDGHAVPDSVSELVRHRVATLSKDGRDALSTAAVLGAVMREELLARTLRLGGGPVGAADELLERNLLVRVGDREVGFAHAIVRDAVYGQLPRSRRRRLHLRVAESATALGRDDPDWAASAAHHYLIADDPSQVDPTIDLAVRAAERAMGVRDHERAAGLYHRLLHYASRYAPGDPRTASLHVGLGEALRRGGDLDGAQIALGVALERSRADEKGAVFADAVLQLVAKGWRGAAVEMSDDERAVLLVEAVERVGDVDPARSVALLVELARALAITDQHERRRGAAEQACRLARQTDRTELLARVVEAQRLLLTRPDGAVKRLAFTDDLVGPRQAQLGTSQMMHVRSWRLADHLELGDRAGLEHELAELAELADEAGLPYWAWFVTSWQALLTFLDGSPTEADAQALAAIEGFTDVDHVSRMLAYGIQHIGFRLQQGRGGEVVDGLRFAADSAPGVTAMRCALMLALAQVGQWPEASELLASLVVDEFAAVPDDLTWSVCMACVAATCCELGDEATAARLVPVLEPYGDHFVHLGAGGPGGACWGPFSAFLGSLRACVGDDHGARRDYERAIEAAERFGAPLLVDQIEGARDRWLGSGVGSGRAAGTRSG